MASGFWFGSRLSPNKSGGNVKITHAILWNGRQVNTAISLSMAKQAKAGMERLWSAAKRHIDYQEGALMKVRVINLPGAPKAKTMGQCYVGDRATGKSRRPTDE